MSVLAPLKHLIHAFFTYISNKNKENKSKIKKTFFSNQKRRTHHRYAFSPRGLERKSPITGSQASLQPANILFPLNRDP